MDAARTPQATQAQTPPPWIRVAVREVLEHAPGYRGLDSTQRRSLAQDMVKVSSLAAALIAEENAADAELAGRSASPPLATAQSQPGFGEAASRIASTTRNVLNAVSFPRFVTDLINGVFKAMLDANAQQMQQYVQLLNAVSTSAEGFERSQFGLAQVRQWVADHFPEAIEYEQPDPDDDPDPDEIAAVRLRLRSGASMPGEPEIRATLGVPPEQSIDASNPEQLVPLARRYLAQQRQQQLATMVMLGMQRIVIDSGRINASMRFHIDTRSAAAEDRGSEFGMRNRVSAGGSFGVGPWGASAEVENTISYVSTQRNQNTEELNTDLELNSSVELNFHTDYLPLNQMAAQAQADRIRNSTLNPAATPPDPSAARSARLSAQQQAEQQRRAGIDSAVGAHRGAAATPAPAAAPRPATPAARPSTPPTRPTAGRTAAPAATPSTRSPATRPTTPATRSPTTTTTTPSTTPTTTTAPSASTPPATTTTPSTATPPATTTTPSTATTPSTTTTPSATTTPATATAPSTTTAPATTTTPSTTTAPGSSATPATGTGGGNPIGTAIGNLAGSAIGELLG